MAVETIAGAQAPQKRARLVFLDNLKALLTVLVVAHHAAQAYGPTGGDWPVSESVRSRWLGPFITVNSMFFMGLFFFVSGYFTPGALSRKGTGRFCGDRLLRLGLPSLAWLAFLRVATHQFNFAHMWFAVDLLALNLLYAGWRAWRPVQPGGPRRLGLPSSARICLLVLLIGVATAAVRIDFPVDRWVRALGVFPMELAHWPQYLSLFLLGLWASATDWPSTFGGAQGRTWLRVAAAAVAFYSAYRLWPGRSVSWFDTGGFNGRSLAYSVLEALICVSLSIGLIWLFRERANRELPVWRTLAPNSYGIYFIHILPVVIVQRALLPSSLDSFAKFLIATLVALLASWAVSEFILRRAPGLRRIF